MNHDPRELTRQLRGLDPASDDALELARQALVLDGGRPHRLEAAVATVISTWAQRVVAHAAKGGPRLADRAEAEAEAQLWLLEQLREFRPAEVGGSVAVFVRARLSWFRSRVRRGESNHQQSHSAYTISSAAGKAREEFLRTERRDPTAQELKDAVQVILVAQAASRMLETGEFASEAELETAARARMRKDGLLAALDRFDEIRVESLQPIPLQVLEPREEDPRPHWGVALPVLEDAEFDAVNPEVEYERLLQVALGDQQWARRAFSARAGDSPSGAEGVPDSSTLRSLADEEHRSVAEVKSVLVAARARVSAPHAQWAHLAPSLEVERA